MCYLCSPQRKETQSIKDNMAQAEIEGATAPALIEIDQEPLGREVICLQRSTTC